IILLIRLVLHSTHASPAPQAAGSSSLATQLLYCTTNFHVPFPYSNATQFCSSVYGAKCSGTEFEIAPMGQASPVSVTAASSAASSTSIASAVASSCIPAPASEPEATQRMLCPPSAVEEANEGAWTSCYEACSCGMGNVGTGTEEGDEADEADEEDDEEEPAEPWLTTSVASTGSATSTQSMTSTSSVAPRKIGPAAGFGK
ncbi:hypothetical protein P7C71_g1581, partial [Lecanoromycetidae sp. Uapishka_2]